MKVAIVGCTHGKLDTVYDKIITVNNNNLQKGEPLVELLISCGDFQAMRNRSDLETLKAHPKHRIMGDFHEYYAGRKQAPVLTLVIGGNHEAMGYFRECFHGAWIAPSIYFLGYSGCVIVDGWLRIAGSSGIYVPRDYKKGHFEQVPFQGFDVSSAYRTRQYDIERLLMLNNFGPKVDIFISHDWPRGIEKHGDEKALLEAKPGFLPDLEQGTMFSPVLNTLLHALKPTRWLSGHHHTRFDATVIHGPDSQTQFLALGKPGEGPWYDILDIEVPQSFSQLESSSPTNEPRIPTLYFDPHWLAIIRAFDPFFPSTPRPAQFPNHNKLKSQLDEAFKWVRENVLPSEQEGNLKKIQDVQRFCQTAPCTKPDEIQQLESTRRNGPSPPAVQKYQNPQTKAVCEMLGIPVR